MKIKYLKVKNWLLLSLASLLGISTGCSTGCGGEEYGCPEADYRVKGTVVDEQGAPVEGIGVMKRYEAHENRVTQYSYADTTDAEGRFDVKQSSSPGYSYIPVEFHDTDSNQHGLYADTTVNVSFEGARFSGGDGNWFEGTATKEITVTLNKQSEK